MTHTTAVTSVNGVMVAADTPAISPLDRGITLGDGIFETVKVEHGDPWYLERHVLRLEHAAAVMGIAVPPQLRAWVAELLQYPSAPTDRSLALRITLTRGSTTTHGLAGTEPSAPTVICSLYAAPAFPAPVYEAGLSAHVASAPRNERAFTAGIKTTSYAESIFALREARAVGCDDAIFIDTHGAVAEGAASNIFARLGDSLVTPPVGRGILPGITRAVVLSLAHELGIPYEERSFSISDLLRAGEVLLTSSLRGIAPVVRIDGYPIGAGTPGTYTRQLMTAYATQPTRV